MLVNEYYPVTLVVSNPYNIILGDVKINYTVPQQYRNKGKCENFSNFKKTYKCSYIFIAT